MVGVRGGFEAALALALEPLLLDQASHARPADGFALFHSLLADTPGAIGLAAVLVNLLH